MFFHHFGSRRKCNRLLMNTENEQEYTWTWLRSNKCEQRKLSWYNHSLGGKRGRRHDALISRQRENEKRLMKSLRVYSTKQAESTKDLDETKCSRAEPSLTPACKLWRKLRRHVLSVSIAKAFACAKRKKMQVFPSFFSWRNPRKSFTLDVSDFQ